VNQQNSGTVLVVEDEQLVRDFLRKILEKAGYKVRLASNAKEALRIWRKARKEIRLVITDIVMPSEMDGFMLGRYLVAREPSLPILYITGTSPTPAEKIPSTNQRLLCKPFTPAALLRTVRQLLALAMLV
jgi:CheY-like chemotaxis protein